MIRREALGVAALDAAKVSSAKDLQQSIPALASHVQALVKAPVGEPFTGPALFEPQAAAQLLAQLLGDNLRIQRKPITDANRPVNVIVSEFEGRTGSRVMPEWLDVVDDSTQTAWQGKALAGYFPFDFEGVKPKAVSLIEKGVLKGFLTTPQPLKNLPPTKGNPRFPRGFATPPPPAGHFSLKA